MSERELLFSTSGQKYLLDLVLTVAYAFERIGDDIVDGVIEGFHLDVDEASLDEFFTLLHQKI